MLYLPLPDPFPTSPHAAADRWDCSPFGHLPFELEQGVGSKRSEGQKMRDVSQLPPSMAVAPEERQLWNILALGRVAVSHCCYFLDVSL